MCEQISIKTQNAALAVSTLHYKPARNYVGIICHVLQVVAPHVVNVDQTGALPTSVQFKISSPGDVQPSVNISLRGPPSRLCWHCDANDNGMH